MKPIMLQWWDSSQTESKQSVTFVASGWHTLLFFAGLHVTWTKGNPHFGILAKSRILDFVIWNVAQGIRNSAIRNPTWTENESGIHYFECGMHGVESWIRDCLGFSYTRRILLLTFDQKGEGTKIGLFCKRRSNLSAKQASRVWSTTF